MGEISAQPSETQQMVAKTLYEACRDREGGCQLLNGEGKDTMESIPEITLEMQNKGCMEYG